LQHEKKDIHEQGIKYLQDDMQSKLFLPSSTSLSSDPNPTVKLETIYYSNGHFVAELYWLTKMANCNYIVEDLVKLDLPLRMHFDETNTSQVKKWMDLTLLLVTDS